MAVARARRPRKALGPEPALAEARQHLKPTGVLELVGRTEAASIIGVEPSNLTQLVGLPDPVVDYLLSGRLWFRRDIEQFARERQRRLAR